MTINTPSSTLRIAAGLSLGAAMSLLTPAHADAHLNGTSYPTIQEAVNAAAPGDLVEVGPGTYTGGGDTVVRFLDKPITVRAIGGPNQTVIDGQGMRRGVLITAFGDVQGEAVLEGFTIMNGDAIDHGGGVLMGGRSRLVNCRVVDSSAPVGGGVAVLGAWPVSDGVHSFVGGFEDVLIQGNLATSHGGGVALLGTGDPGDLRFTLGGQVSIEDNGSGARGGGLYADTASIGLFAGPEVNGLTFSGNHAFGTGGGLHARFSEVDLDGAFSVLFARNRADANGGGCALVSCRNARLQLATFGDNEARGANAFGGGLWSKDGSYELVQSEFEGNVAEGGGGAIRNRRTDAVLVSCRLDGNTALGAGGGGISAEECTNTTIMNSVISGNQGRVDGGGIHAFRDEVLSILNCEIRGNRSFSSSDPDHTYGGGAWLQDVSLASSGNVWSNNSAGYGGGLFALNLKHHVGTTVSRIDSDEFNGNAATSTNGGGAYLTGDGIWEIDSCTFIENTSSTRGSGLAAVGNSGVPLTLRDSHFIANGGSIHEAAVGLSNAIAVIEGCVFKDNAGAGIMTLLDTDLEVIDSCFCNNFYGVFNQSSNSIGIGGCRFASNAQEDASGDWFETGMNFFMTICPCGSGPANDITGDGIIDGADIAALLGAWGTSDPAADLNQDGVVDGIDLSILLASW